ncbi:MAG: LPS-assembly lipoprotein [Candidatus Tokpelaia sp. JSC189]|nr:MAG: LPS-assembly lipoprotein [Candidatus Tokpelaia sp. JSC189]
MSSFNHLIKGVACGNIIGLLTILAACSVQPLYSSKTVGDNLSSVVTPDIRRKLSSIAIDSPNDRMTQLVRNQLIFLLSGGADQLATPAYQLALNIHSYVQTAVRVDIGDRTEYAGRASVGTVTAISNYILKDSEGKPLAMHKRSIISSFDRPRQEYANLAAEENAKKRAAEELAERIFLSLVQDISRY